MGFIIFVAVVILAIYLIKKSSSDKNSSFEEPAKSQISFDNLSQEELNDRIPQSDAREKYALPSLSR